MKIKYEEDFYGWAMANAIFMRKGQLKKLDIDNLIEEIESMGRREKNALISHFSILVAHLLKWHYQPEFRTRPDGTVNRSWQLTIKNQRNDLRELLEENPSLKSKVNHFLEKIYLKALVLAEEETGLHLETFPQEFPYTIEECLDDEFFPN